MDDLVALLGEIGRLKSIKRAGWVLKGVPDVESVADHSFRTAMMALLLARKNGLDENKCVKMALIHDVAESIVGDVTPHDIMTPEEKHVLERQAFNRLFDGTVHGDIISLWDEYEARETPEAKFVYELDKMEMLVQAYEYEMRHGKTVDLGEFWTHVKAQVSNEELKLLQSMLMGKRRGALQ